METKTFSQISKHVNVMVDACNNIVKSKNLHLNMPKNEQLRLINLHRREQEKKEKKSITKEERGKKEEKQRVNKKKKPRNHKPLMTARPERNVRAPQLFQETLTPRWFATLL